MYTELLFLHCDHMPRCTASVDKDFRDYYTLQYMTAGEVELFYGEERHLMQGTWFWPAYPGVHIRFGRAPGCAWWTHRYVAFRGPLVNRWISDGLFPNGPQAAPRDKKHAALFDQLLNFARRADGWGSRRAVNALESLLLELAEARAMEARAVEEQAEAWLKNVLHTLDNEAGFAPDYEAVAKQHGMALSTLRRRFRAATGVPIHEYSLQCRIARARRFLGETDWPLKTIAEKLGYSDLYFFARQFKEQTGVPPAAYRKSRQV
jgi:AraC-like DNA-binding protein